MLDRLSNKISCWICDNAKIEGELREVITYGIMAIIHIAVFAAVIVSVGLLTDTFLPIMVICWSAALFRQQSGGAHAENALFCTTIGCVVCFLFSIACRELNKTVLTKTLIAAFSVLMFAWAVYIVFKVVPVDSPNKPIKTDKKKKRMKRNSRIVLALCAIAVTLSLALGSAHSAWSLFAVSISVGIGWQTFMLTKGGQVFAKAVQKPLKALYGRLNHH